MDDKEGMMERANRQNMPMVEESVGTISESLSTSSILIIISSIIGIIIAIIVVKKYHRCG